MYSCVRSRRRGLHAIWSEYLRTMIVKAPSLDAIENVIIDRNSKGKTSVIISMNRS